MRFDLHDDFYLDEVREGDQPALIEHFSDKKTCERLLRIPYPYTQNDADAWVRHCEETTLGNRLPHQFACRRADGYLIGGAGLMLNTTPASSHRAELGYWIAADFRGRGLATMAARALIEYGFRGLSLKRIEATSSLYNLASVRVLEKAGLKREGLLTAYHTRNHELIDVYLYAIVAQPSEQAVNYAV